MGKQRPYLGRRGIFTPLRTVNAEQEIDILSRQFLPSKFKPFTCALRVTVNFMIKKPKAYPKRMKYPIKRPDLDNYLKLILDALNGVIWKDDSIICEITTSKSYVSRQELAGIELIVEPIA